MTLTNSQPEETPFERVFKPELVDFAGGIVAIFTGLASIAAYIYSAIENPTDASVALITIGVLSLVLCAGIAGLAFAYAQKVRKVRKLSNSETQLRNRLDKERRNLVVSVESLSTIFGEFSEQQDLHGDRSPHLGLFVNNVKAIFDRLSDSGQSAVCIKLLEHDHERSESDGPYVWTAKRDDTSLLRRGKTDERPDLELYAPDNNKAFSDIMSRNVGKDWFFSNNLRAMSNYFNSNPHWRDFYNAAVVVPIKPCRADVLKSAIGFLCVDSLHGTFNEDVAVAILMLVAEMLYRHLQNLADYLPDEPE